MVVGEVDVCDRMDWKELDRVVVHRFQTFVHIIDLEEDIGLKVNSIKHYTIGDHVRFLGTPPPELLPIGYIVGDVKSIHLKLKDHEDDRIDAFAFDSLLPISILQAHLQSLWKHKRFLLVGCPKSGKTYLGRLLAYHVASLLSKNSPTFASELINEYNFSNFKSDQSLPSILSAKKPVLLLDNLHHVTSLPNHSQDVFDFLPQKIIIIITIDSSSFSSSSLVESLRDKHQFAIVSVDTIYKNNNINNQKNDSQNNKNNINNRSKTRSLIKQQEGGEFLSRFHKRICFLFHYHLHINREMGGWMDEKGIVKDRWMDDRNQLCFNTHIDDETLKRNNKNTNSKNEKNKKNNNNDTNFHYNNLKLSTNKSSKTNPQHSHDMRIIRHQKTVKWLEDLWDRLEGLGVGVSPLLFVSAPQQPSLSELWFVRLWNLSIVPVIRCRINNKNNKKNNNKNKTKKIDENGDVEKNKNERKKADENEMGNGRSNEIAQINTNMKAQLRATKKCCDNAVDSNDDDEEDDDDDGDEEDGGDDSDCHSLNAHAWERFVKWLLDTYPWDKNKSNNITNCNNKNNEKNDFNENEGTKMIENNSINININNKDKNDLLLRLFGQEGDRENVNKNNDNNGKNKNNDSNRNNNENNKHKNNNNNSNINENKDNNSNFYDDDVEDVIEEKLRVLVDEIEEEDEDGCDDNDSRKTYDKTLKKNGDKKGDVKKKKNIENEVLNKLDSLVSLSGDDDDEEVEDEDILLIQEDDE